MEERHTSIRAQTSKQAKAEYKRHGPRISSQEARRIARGAELYERAERLKAKERRSKQAKEKRAMREQRVRTMRRESGLPSQPLPKVAASQKLLSAFVGRAVQSHDQSAAADDQIPLSQQSPCQQRQRRANQSHENEPFEDLDDETLLDTVDDCKPTSTTAIPNGRADSLDLEHLLCTQDVGFTIDELDNPLPDNTSSERKKLDADRQLMPPPPKPCMRNPPRSSSSSDSQKTSQLCSILELAPDDFDLSTQDCREIDCY
ncbi:MAG: hypothetical protein Q9159_000859 [Coniocarpon cinnabarinum]